MDNNTNCLSKTLKLIDVLQKNAEQNDCLDNTCSRPFLGVTNNIICFNTRPVTFYGCDNNLITIDYNITIDETPLIGRSGIFRVEKVEDDCCVVSILIDNPTPTSTSPYISTGQTATINLDCVCAIKCLPDTIINI